MLLPRLAIVISCCVIGGCQPATNSPQNGVVISPGGASTANGAAAASSQWPFWPTAMRVHPLTRIVHNRDAVGERVLELRIEFKDRDGVVCRAWGSLHVDLYDRSPTGRGNGVINTWELDLRDLALNAERFDDVMQHYFFRLKVLENETPEQPEVQTYYNSADGTLMEAAGFVQLKE